MKTWKKVLLWTAGACAALFLVVLAFGPMILAPIVRSKVVAALNERLNGSAELQEFSFGWGGGVHIGGLAIRDAAGEVVFSVKRIEVATSVMSALGGTYIADIRIEDPAVVVRHHADGTFNFQALMKPGPAKAPPTGDEKLPTVKATVSLTGGQATFRHEDGRRTQVTLDARCTVDTLDRPIAFEVTVGGIGAIATKGEVTVASAGRLDLDHLHGPVGLTMSDVSLAKLLPVVSAFAPLSRFDGTLGGRADYELTSMVSARGGTSLELRGLDVEGAALPQPVKLDILRLSQKAEMDGEGSGTASFRLEVGGFLTAAVDATAVRIATDMGTADAMITVDADLKGLTDAFGALLQMRQDSTLDGTASLRTSVSAALGRKALGAARVSVDAKLDRLSARDGSGRALPIDPTATVAFRASFEPRAPLAWTEMPRATGTAKVEACEVRAGTVVVTAHAVADLSDMSLGDSALQADADLDDVARKIAFLNLGFSFGGRIHVDSKLEGTSDVAKATSTVRVSALRLTGLGGKDLGPIDLTLDEVGTVDLRPGGKSTLESFRLVSGLVDAEARAEATDATDVAKASGSASFTVRAFPAAIQQKLGDFLGGYKLSGSDLLVSGDATFRGKDVTLKGDLKTRALALLGPTLGPRGATLKDVSVLYDLDCDGETLDALVRDLTLECGVVDLALRASEASARVDRIVAKLSGSRKGDAVVARADVKVRDVTALSPRLGPKGAVATGISLDCDATANLRTLEADAKRAVLGIATIDAWSKGATTPASVRGLGVVCSGTRKGDLVDLARLELTSSLARGNGKLKVTNLGKAWMAADGRFDFDGEVGPLIDLAKVVVPDLKDAISSGTWQFGAAVATQGSRIEVSPKLAIRRMSLHGADVGDTPLKVENADIAFESRVLVDTEGAGKATIEICSLTAPGARIEATGSAGGFLSDPMALAATVHVDATVEPDELYDRLSAFLLGNRIAGREVKAAADVTVHGDAYAAKGRMTAPELVVTLPPAPPAPGAPPGRDPKPTVIAQRDLVAEFDILADLRAEHIEIRRCSYESRSARGTVEGAIDGSGGRASADVTIRADADLAQVRNDFGSMMPESYELRGRASAKFVVAGRGTITITGGATIEDFSLTAPNARLGGTTTVNDPRISLVCDAVVTRTGGIGGRTDIELRNAAVGSGFLSASASGSLLDATGDTELRALKGNLVYIPDTLGVVLQPWLFGGTLTGEEEQRVSFTLDGKARDFHLVRMLRGSQGAATIGIGQFTMTGLAATGTVDATIRDEHAIAVSNLGVNGGLVEMRADIDLREPSGTTEPVTTMSLELKKVGANAEVSPILQLLHPIFGQVKGANGLIEGQIDATLDLSYRAPVTTDLLKGLNKPEAAGGGWKNFRKDPMFGRGRFAVTGLSLKGSPFLTEILGAMEVESLEGFDLHPIDFAIRSGRVHYQNPVILKIGGLATQWTGSIGLDQTLDLAWEIPVTDRLLAKHPFLKYWAGQSLRVKVKGTCARPELGWNEMIQDLARQAAQKAIEEKGAEALRELLNKDEKKARLLLEQADKLYEEGKKADATLIYKRIRTDYAKTTVYKRNKDRIEQRESGK
jgi:hypothetical protein